MFLYIGAPMKEAQNNGRQNAAPIQGIANQLQGTGGSSLPAVPVFRQHSFTGGLPESDKPVQRTVNSDWAAADVVDHLATAEGWDLEKFEPDSLTEAIESFVESDTDFDIADVVERLYKIKEDLLNGDMEEESEDEEYDPKNEWSPQIPRNDYQTRKVDGTTYKLFNDGKGSLDNSKGFESTGLAAETVDIRNSSIFKNNSLKASRYLHFKASNELAGNKGIGGLPPTGYTWHHRIETGLMQLIPRKLHAAFFHRGGFAEWGS